MSEQWTKLAEHMQRMEEEMGKPKYFSNDPDKPRESTKKSAKYLWLAWSFFNLFSTDRILFVILFLNFNKFTIQSDIEN